MLIPYPSFKYNATYEDVVKVFSQAINLDPANVDAYIGKGQVLLAMAMIFSMADTSDIGKKDKILDAFIQALRLDSENEVASIGMGDTLAHFENNEEAVEYYKRAIECSLFSNRDTYKKLGKALQKLKRYEEALEAYTICIKQDVQKVDLYEGIAETLQALKRYEEALQFYDKALSFNSKDLINLGKTYIKKGKLLYSIADNQNAFAAFEKALNLLPEYATTVRAEAHRGKGTVLQFLANWEFQIADELEPPMDLTSLEDWQDEPEEAKDELPGWEDSLEDHPF
jgi:tetratricopeptide (TPR) repeat protein